MSKSQRNGGVVAILILSAFGVASIAYYIHRDPRAQRVPDELLRHDPSSEVLRHGPKAADTAVHAPAVSRDTILLPNVEGSTVSLGDSQTAVPDGKTPFQFLAEHILKSVGPSDSKVIGVELQEHVAIVNLSPEVKSGMGSMQESDFLKAFQVGFGQFREVDKVWFQIDGQPVDSIGEHISTTDPVPVIRPGEEEQSPTPSAP